MVLPRHLSWTSDKQLIFRVPEFLVIVSMTLGVVPEAAQAKSVAAPVVRPAMETVKIPLEERLRGANLLMSDAERRQAKNNNSKNDRKHLKADSLTLSAMFDELVDLPSLRSLQTIAVIDGDDLPLIGMYLWPNTKQDPLNYDASGLNANRRLSLLYWDKPTLYNTSGHDAYAMNISATSAATLAASGALGAAVPQIVDAKIVGAIKKESTKRTELSVVAGTFHNALADALLDIRNRVPVKGDAFLPAQDLWERYQGGTIDSLMGIMSDVGGIVVDQQIVDVRKASQDVTAKTELAVRMGIIDLEGSLSASALRDHVAGVTDKTFQFYFTSAPAIQRIPSPSDIVATWRMICRPIVVYQAGPTARSQTLTDGVPADVELRFGPLRDHSQFDAVVASVVEDPLRVLAGVAATSHKSDAADPLYEFVTVQLTPNDSRIASWSEAYRDGYVKVRLKWNTAAVPGQAGPLFWTQDYTVAVSIDPQPIVECGVPTYGGVENGWATWQATTSAIAATGVKAAQSQIAVSWKLEDSAAGEIPVMAGDTKVGVAFDAGATVATITVKVLAARVPPGGSANVSVPVEVQVPGGGKKVRTIGNFVLRAPNTPGS